MHYKWEKFITATLIFDCVPVAVSQCVCGCVSWPIHVVRHWVCDQSMQAALQSPRMLAECVESCPPRMENPSIKIYKEYDVQGCYTY